MGNRKREQEKRKMKTKDEGVCISETYGGSFQMPIFKFKKMQLCLFAL